MLHRAPQDFLRESIEQRSSVVGLRLKNADCPFLTVLLLSYLAGFSAGSEAPQMTAPLHSIDQPVDDCREELQACDIAPMLGRLKRQLGLKVLRTHP